MLCMMLFKWPFSISLNWAGHFKFWSWISISINKWFLFLYVKQGSGMYCNIRHLLLVQWHETIINSCNNFILSAVSFFYTADDLTTIVIVKSWSSPGSSQSTSVKYQIHKSEHDQLPETTFCMIRIWSVGFEVCAILSIHTFFFCLFLDVHNKKVYETHHQNSLSLCYLWIELQWKINNSLFCWGPPGIPLKDPWEPLLYEIKHRSLKNMLA